ncbi:MAG: Gfo/Idh/MocA family protein [bacterium]
MRKLKVAMIGCGRVSRKYKQVFKDLDHKIDVLYAVDSDIERAEDFAREFASCSVAGDYQEILDKNLDVFHIATPHYLHCPITVEALEHGINVLTEKPMAINLQDADRMIETADREGAKLGVIYQTRYVKGCMELKEIIESGKLGKIKAARSYLSWKRSDEYYANSEWKGTWDKEGGGVLIDQAIHSIDRVQWLIGSDVDWIQGTIDNRFHKSVKVEDVAEAFIQFKNGCTYQLYACNCYSYDAPIEIEIVGEKGKVGLKQDLAWIDLEEEDYYEIKDGYDGLRVGPSYWGCSHITQINDFYDSVLDDKPVFIDGPAGRKSLEIVKGIYKSAIRDKKINLPFEDEIFTAVQ